MKLYVYIIILRWKSRIVFGTKILIEKSQSLGTFLFKLLLYLHKNIQKSNWINFKSNK